MRSVFALLALAALARAQSKPAAELYVRPLDDCVRMPAGAAAGSLFPDQFRVAGSPVETGEPFVTEITNAAGFSVEYHETYKLVRNSIVNETYVLVQCGAPPPPAAALPAGAKVFEVPLSAVSVPGTVPLAFMEALGLSDRVASVSPYAVSACAQAVLACDGAAPDYAQLSNATYLAAELGSYTDALLTDDASPYPGSFAFSAALDRDVLARAEWFKFLGLFFNRERAASDAYDAVRAAYEETRAAAATSAPPAGRPVAAFASFYSYDGEESYQISMDPYKLKLAADAGAGALDAAALAALGAAPGEFAPDDLVFSWGEGGAFATREAAHAAFLTALAGADVVVDETYAVDPTAYDLAAFEAAYDLGDATAAQRDALKWLASGAILRTDGLVSADGGLDWFEGAFARPDEVLADAARAARAVVAGKTAEETGFIWLRPVQQPPVVLTAADCGGATSCDGPPAPICPFVRPCADGSNALLATSGDNAAAAGCEYEACGDAGDALELSTPANAAQMAAPAVVLLALLVVFVEALINFC